MKKQYSDETEQIGLENLEEMNRFTQWMYEQVQPWLGEHVMEAGAGIGTYSAMAWNEGKAVTAVELSDNYFAILSKRFEGKERFQVIHGSVTDPALAKELAQKSIDTVFSLNVLEHVDEDEVALKHFFDILSPGGRLVVLVPAHMFLHNSLDEALGHVRRYTKRELQQKVERAGFTVRKVYYWNSLAIAGWYVNGNLMKKKEVAQGVARLYDRFVPFLRFVEKYILHGTLGISAIVVAEKK